MPNHTPGPWTMDIATGKIYDAQGTHIATMAPTCVTGTWEANARLVIAAPEMLALLRDLVNHGMLTGVGTQARALLARVEGVTSPDAAARDADREMGIREWED